MLELGSQRAADMEMPRPGSEGCGEGVLCLTLGFSLGVVIAVVVGVHPTAPNTLHFVESRLGVLDFLFKGSRFCL